MKRLWLQSLGTGIVASYLIVGLWLGSQPDSRRPNDGASWLSAFAFATILGAGTATAIASSLTFWGNFVSSDKVRRLSKSQKTLEAARYLHDIGAISAEQLLQIGERAAAEQITETDIYPM